MRSARWSDKSAVSCRLVLLMTIIFTLPPSTFQEIAKACPDGTSNSPVELTLGCPPGEVLSLGEAVIGRNRDLLCWEYEPGDDCRVSTDAFTQAGCQGRLNCTVNITQTFIPHCGYATYVTVSYNCLPPAITHVTSSTSEAPSTSSSYGVTTPKPRVNHHVNATPRISEDDDNTALIAGCVLAVTVTVILLIIAIVMLIRRLKGSSEPSTDAEKVSSSCFILPCRGAGGAALKRPPQDGGSTPRSEQNARHTQRSDNTPGTRRAGRSSNMAARLAPVGQEDDTAISASQGCRAGADNSQANFSSAAMEAASDTVDKRPLTRTGKGVSSDTVNVSIHSSVPRSEKQLLKESASSTADWGEAEQPPRQYDAVALPNTEAFSAC